uniref:RNA helicase n=1 Tax=Hirondellea gigas TaxID=1518452 RepID=A0A2P2HZF4_9CRUS
MTAEVSTEAAAAAATGVKSIMKDAKIFEKKKSKGKKLKLKKTLSIEGTENVKKSCKSNKVEKNNKFKSIKKEKTKKKTNKIKIQGKDNANKSKSSKEESTTKETTNVLAFHKMGLDDRILEGIAAMRWNVPTLVQERAIPFMLQGKTVIAQARTGSGKTGAFLVPCLHRILVAKENAQEQCIRVLVLAPSKELCRQISEMGVKLSASCSRELRVLDLSPQLPLSHQKPFLAELPDVVVGPPGRVLAHLLEGNMSLKNIQSVVVDEADLMMAYQHIDALEQIWSYLPDYYQCFVTSATLSKDLNRINRLLLRSNDLILHNTVVLKLKDPPLPTQGQLTQYVIKLEEFEKGVLLYALYRLRMMTGKTIIFVNSVNKGYKLRMFLGQFGIASCILNCELPSASRCDIIEQFNAGRYDTIIATDETSLEKQSKKYKLNNVESDAESGPSRGLDYQFVCNIVNFDFPTSVTSYIHRVGRTARGNNKGSALSMVSVKEHDTYMQVSDSLTKLMNVGQNKVKGKTNDEGMFKKYVFDLSQLDGFSYRARDVWQMCTNVAVMETRKREISQQLLNSKKLATFFHENPSDRALLKHDKKAHGIKTQNHLKHVPEYMIPDKLRAGAVVVKKHQPKRLQAATSRPRTFKDKKTKGKKYVVPKGNLNDPETLTKTQRRHAVVKADPLKSFTFTGFNTK